jgi:hypothetical protein
MAYNTVGILQDGHFRTKGLPYESEIGFLIIMDLLGVKGIWKTPDYENHFNKWTNINYFIDDCFNKLPFQFNRYCFSDTIIITINAQNYNKNNNLLNYIRKIGITIGNIIQESVKNDLFFRGSISFGKYLKSSNSIIGPAIDDASICYDKSEIIGVIVSSDFKKILDNLYTNSFDCYPFIKYDIQINKSILQNWWLLNWNYNQNKQCMQILKVKSKYYFNNPKIKIKYTNTLAAFN